MIFRMEKMDGMENDERLVILSVEEVSEELLTRSFGDGIIKGSVKVVSSYAFSVNVCITHNRSIEISSGLHKC